MRRTPRALCEATAQLDPAIANLDPRWHEQRHKAANQTGRGVWLRPLPDGMAGLSCVLDAVYRKACLSELDHIVPFNGHNTVESNLQPTCCRHHHVRHEAGWTPKRRDDGITEWISPTGRIYQKPPDPYPGAEPEPPPPEPKTDEDPPPF